MDDSANWSNIGLKNVNQINVVNQGNSHSSSAEGTNNSHAKRMQNKPRQPTGAAHVCTTERKTVSPPSSPDVTAIYLLTQRILMEFVQMK
jgi:hypothetical protein